MAIKKDPDLLKVLKGTDKKIDLKKFKSSMLKLFHGIINEDGVDVETRGKIARLRARIEIELRDIE